MTPDFIPTYIWLSLKILSLVGIGLYTIFAAIMVRQEQLMSEVLEEQFEPILRLITIIHLAASLIVFALAIVLL